MKRNVGRHFGHTLSLHLHLVIFMDGIAGPPFVRPVPPVKAVAGKGVHIQCPVSGYPIEVITWEKGTSPPPHFIFITTEIKQGHALRREDSPDHKAAARLPQRDPDSRAGAQGGRGDPEVRGEGQEPRPHLLQGHPAQSCRWVTIFRIICQ